MEFAIQFGTFSKKERGKLRLYKIKEKPQIKISIQQKEKVSFSAVGGAF